VGEPAKLIVKNAPRIKVTLNFHPQNDLGFRKIETDGTFFVSRSDFSEKEGQVVRLKDLYNIKVLKVVDVIEASFHSKELLKTEKFQWVTEECIPVSVDIVGPLFIDDRYNPESLRTIEGYAEIACEKLREGDIV